MRGRTVGIPGHGAVFHGSDSSFLRAVLLPGQIQALTGAVGGAAAAQHRAGIQQRAVRHVKARRHHILRAAAFRRQPDFTRQQNARLSGVADSGDIALRLRLAPVPHAIGRDQIQPAVGQARILIPSVLPASIHLARPRRVADIIGRHAGLLGFVPAGADDQQLAAGQIQRTEPFAVPGRQLCQQPALRSIGLIDVDGAATQRIDVPAVGLHHIGLVHALHLHIGAGIAGAERHVCLRLRVCCILRNCRLRSSVGKQQAAAGSCKLLVDLARLQRCQHRSIAGGIVFGQSLCLRLFVRLHFIRMTVRQRLLAVFGPRRTGGLRRFQCRLRRAAQQQAGHQQRRDKQRSNSLHTDRPFCLFAHWTQRRPRWFPGVFCTHGSVDSIAFFSKAHNLAGFRAEAIDLYIILWYSLTVVAFIAK